MFHGQVSAALGALCTVYTPDENGKHDNRSVTKLYKVRAAVKQKRLWKSENAC